MAASSHMMRWSTLRFGVVSTALALAGCGSGSADDPWADVANAMRDSAGVAITESAAPLWSDRDGWRVGAWPLLTIEATPGADQDPERRVVDGARLSDGRLVLIDGISEEVRFYDARGAPLASIPAAALGLPTPAVLTGLVRLDGDSLSVYAGGGGGHVARLGPGGEPRGATAVSWAGSAANDPLRFRPTGPLAGGGILLVPTGIPDDRDLGSGVAHSSAPNLVVSADGRVTGTLGDPSTMSVFADSALIPLPLGRRTRGEVAGGVLYQAHGESREVRIFGAAGDLRRIVRRIDPARRLTSVFWDEELARLAVLSGAGDPEVPDSAGNPGGVAGRRARLARIPRPDRFPASGAVEVDPAGRIWLQEYVRADTFDPQLWSVFDPEGRWLGQVSLTAGIEVFEIGEDHILGVITDPLGVERMQLLEITRPVGGA
jgi:hypothetical protein